MQLDKRLGLSLTPAQHLTRLRAVGSWIAMSGWAIAGFTGVVIEHMIRGGAVSWGDKEASK